jgi:hypothetical protein
MTVTRRSDTKEADVPILKNDFGSKGCAGTALTP